MSSLFPRGPASPRYKVKQRNNNWWQPDFQLWSQAGVTNHSLLVHTSLDAPEGRCRFTELHSLQGTQQQESSCFPVPSPLLPVLRETQDCLLCPFGRPGIWGSVPLDPHSCGLPVLKVIGYSHLCPGPPNGWASPKCPEGCGAPAVYWAAVCGKLPPGHPSSYSESGNL